MLNNYLLDNPLSIFMFLKGVLTDRLIPLGYLLIKEELLSVFDSCYIDFQRENRVIRFIWDGRDQRYYLTECNDIQKYLPSQNWENLLAQPYDEKNTNQESTQKLIKKIIEFVSILS